ncbi:high mobility group protein [Ostreococcus tauri]|uniref:High mobility group protein n=1 Tax=Ostreococcus tauri TaxID=70448 RepID=A0A1Y5IBC4_OSTTA|nr:high mobility group protein [Ostreococcus tauri]
MVEGKLDGEILPAPPKRALTAYLIFCQRHRERIMREIQPDPSSKFTKDQMQQVTTRLAGLWNNISPKELKEVQGQAAKCKAEYEAQKAQFSPAMLKKIARMRNKPKGHIVVPAQGEKPVRAKTAYLIFCSRHRKDIMRQIHRDPLAKFTRAEMQQVTTTLADMWNKISPSELASCREEAKVELEKYRALKAEYRAPVYGPAKKPKVNVKGETKPKKAPTAYLVFAEEERQRIKLAEPELKHDEISQRLSRTWKAIDENEKRRYQARAEEQKQNLERQSILPSNSLAGEHLPMMSMASYDIDPRAI